MNLRLRANVECNGDQLKIFLIVWCDKIKFSKQMWTSHSVVAATTNAKVGVLQSICSIGGVKMGLELISHHVICLGTERKVLEQF